MKHRRMIGLKERIPVFVNVSQAKLSDMLTVAAAAGYRLYLCGTLEEMSREWVEEPLSRGWKFARNYIHKYRSPTFQNEESGKEVSCKLVSESWLPGCHDKIDAMAAWTDLNRVWVEATGMPLLSTPSKSGQALLWESLPKGEDFPALPDELADLIRRNSPQHRMQELKPDYLGERWEYDARWMYASCARSDRLPVGEPIQTKEFIPYRPGWYRIAVRVPYGWNHLGLLPTQFDDERGSHWIYPEEPGLEFETWALEPELTFAKHCGWEFEVIDGWAFGRGRPLGAWAKRLIDMRERLSRVNPLAAKAIREVLNHTIGSFHVDGYEREHVLDKMQWRACIRKYGYAGVKTLPRTDEQIAADVHPVMMKEKIQDQLSIFMPHWSGQVWAIERAMIAKWAMRIPRADIIAIRGDAIHSTRELPVEDNGGLGQLRLKSTTSTKGDL